MQFVNIPNESQKISLINSDLPAKEIYTHLSLYDLGWEDILFTNLLPYLNLKELFLLRRVSFQSLQLVDQYFAQLKRICVSNSETSTANFSLLAFKTLTKDCKNARQLILNECGWILDKELISFFASNVSLSHLDLSGCLSLKGTSILPLSVKCKKLKILILRDCNWITQGALVTLMSHLSCLEEVDLSSCSALSNQLIIHFVQRFPLLKRLNLAHIQSINDTTLFAISRCCIGLTHLDIRACMGVTDNGIRSVAEYCSKLSELCVTHCHLVTEYSLRLLRNRGNVNIDREAPENLIFPLHGQFLMVQV